MQTSLLAISLSAVVFLYSVSAEGYVKKSDITEFASAINGAGRLRYGKRANWESLYPEASWDTEDDSAAGVGFDSTGFQYAKRAPMPQNLLQSLNGAERLRFGKK